ncbi:MAG: hypothetical protein HY319_18400, partial [Armatimonadetes bacterium]|nr:hypothetical protein [Armatimonadota bacterium]
MVTFRRLRGVSLLLEILFGLGLFAIAFILVFSLFPTSHHSLTQAKNYALANAAAQEYIAKEKVKDYQAILDASPTLGLVETRSATINGVAVNTTFNVDVTANPLTDVGAGDAYDSA